MEMLNFCSKLVARRAQNYTKNLTKRKISSKSFPTSELLQKCIVNMEQVNLKTRRYRSPLHCSADFVVCVCSPAFCTHCSRRIHRQNNEAMVIL